MSAADNDMADKHGLKPPATRRTDINKVTEEMRQASAALPRHLQDVPAIDQRVPLYMGFLNGALTRPEVHAWFLSKGLADTDVEAAKAALLRLSVAFYK